MSYSGPDRDYATELEHQRYRAEKAEAALAAAESFNAKRETVLVEQRDDLRAKLAAAEAEWQGCGNDWLSAVQSLSAPATAFVLSAR